MTPAAVAALVQNDIASGQGFLKEPVITADTIKSGNSDQSVFSDQLKNAPQAYQKVKKTPMILAVLALAFLITVVVGQVVNINILDLKSIPTLGKRCPEGQVYDPTSTAKVPCVAAGSTK